jgi:AcrR family transcriptional regulator
MQKIDEAAPRPRRGRPRDPRRCRRILDAAREHFHAQGLERASVDAIAADAGVSKMTIYSHFASKEGLFEAVVRDRTDQVVGGIAGVDAMDPEFPEQALLAIGEQFLVLARDEDVLGQFRALYGAAGSQPLACQAFHRQGCRAADHRPCQLPAARNGRIHLVGARAPPRGRSVPGHVPG